MARTSVVITAVASVLFIGMIIGVAISPSSESSSASTAVATAPDSDLWVLHGWLDKATNGILDALLGSSSAKSLGGFLENLLPVGGIRISRIVAIMNGGSINNTQAEDQSQLQYIMDNAKRVQETHGVAAWKMFGLYNTAIWLAYLKLIHQWNVVQGFPTSQDVAIPQCPPHTVDKEAQGFSGYMTPLYDPTITDDPKQQCPTYYKLDQSKIKVAQKWDGTPLEPLLDVLNKMLGMIHGVDSNERSSGADAHSWDMIGGEGKALSWLTSVLGDTLSPFRTLPPYYSFARPEENQFALFPSPSYPAEAIETLAFKGLGQPFLEAVRHGDDNAKGAKYAIYLDFMSELEHKKGLQKTGGDAYFSADRKLAHIVYCGKAYVPSEDGRGWWPWSVDPAADWALAMLVFRGSLNAYVTGPEHLMGLHFNIANGLVIGNAEGLPADHPLRRLITKFTFRTITINRLSAAMLIPLNGLVHRAMPFTVEGLKQVAAKAKAIPRTDVYERFAKSGLPSEFKDSLPFYQDGIAYYELMLNYVNEFLKAAGHDVTASKDTCSGDKTLVEFWGKWKHAAVSDTFPQGPLTCKLLANTLATSFWDVSGYHNVVGTLGSENVDPCFAPWTVVEGATCGAPQESILQIVSFSLTSLYQPKITEDYSHLFKDLNRPALLDVEKKFVEDIRKFSDSQSVPAGSHTDSSYVCFKPANNNTAKTITPNGGPDKIPPGRHFGVETGVSI